MLAFAFGLSACVATVQEQDAAFTVRRTDEAVVLQRGGREVLAYRLRKPAGSPLSVESACYFHPFATPAGVPVTDAAPDDHRHHRGIFLAWVQMHGVRDADFWGWGEHAPKKDRAIVNLEVTDLREGSIAGFRARNAWLAEGIPVLHETLDASLRAAGPAHVLDLAYTLSAERDTRLARWAFSGFCLRARKDGKAEPEGPEGPARFPAPHPMKPESNWPAARWYGMTLRLADGVTVAAAVVDHPGNPPATWHNAIGIRMINPSIVAPGEVTLRAGEPMLLRYRVIVQDGPLSRDLVRRLAEEWAR
jgi:hypothetical protein